MSYLLQIERELILSSDNKNASKMSLASGLHQFLPRMTGNNAVTQVTPENPVKHQIQAWNQINHSQMDQMQQMAMARPTQMPEDVTALVDRDNYAKDGKDGKNAVAKTYHTIKDIISSKFKKDQVTAGSLDELNNATSFQQQIVQQHRISPYAVKKPRPEDMPTMYNGQQVPRPNTDSPIYLQSNAMSSQQYINSQIQAQRAASQPHLHYDPAAYIQQQQQHMQNQTAPLPNERRKSIDNIEVTDSDDGGFINKGSRRSNRTPIMNDSPYLTPNAQSYYEKQKTPQFSAYRHGMVEHVNEKMRHEMQNGHESGRESRNNIIENSRKQATPINNTSDYEKGEHFSSNVDSGRESLAYTPGSRGNTHNGQHNGDGQNVDGNDSEWVDVIDSELKHILEPGMQEMTLNKEGNSISSASPQLPRIMGPPPRPHKPHVRNFFNF